MVLCLKMLDVPGEGVQRVKVSADQEALNGYVSCLFEFDKVLNITDLRQRLQARSQVN